MGAIPAVGGSYTLEQLEALAGGNEVVPAAPDAAATPADDAAEDAGDEN